MNYTDIKLEDTLPMMYRYGCDPDLDPDFTDTIPIWCSNNFKGIAPETIELDELCGYIFFSVGAFVHNVVNKDIYIKAMRNINNALIYYGTSIEEELNL